MTVVIAASSPATPTGPAVGAGLGIVVVSFGPADLLRDNLAAADLTGGGVHVVVVDNFSSVENRRAVEELGSVNGWHVVGLPENRGFGAACNAGTAAARELGCRTFLFLNPDAYVTRAAVQELWTHSTRDVMALISPRLVDASGRVVFRGSRVDLSDGRIRSRPAHEDPARTDPGDWLTAACLVVSDDLLQRIGGFDEDYFLYWEDVDLSLRAVRAGGSLVVRHDLVAVHEEGGTQDRRGRAKSALYYRYNCRNRLLFAARNLGRRGVLQWFLRTPAASWEILLRGGRRQLVHSPRPLWAAVSGSLLGVAMALPALLVGARPHGPRRPPVLVIHPGAELYGSDRVLLESVEALRTRSQVVVALPTRGPLVGELESRGARVVISRMPVLRKSVFRPAGMLRLLRDAALGVLPALVLLRRYGGGGVYVSTTILPFWVLLGTLARRRVVCHVHEAEWPGPRVFQRLLLSPLLAAHTVVANSRFTRDALTRMHPALAARTTVIGNVVRGPAEPTRPRNRIEGPVRLLYVGRLSPRKGTDVAIAALGELVDRGVDARLTLVGSVFEGYEWYEEKLLEVVAGAGLTARVDFLGFRSDVGSLMDQTDVVLVPSVLDESFGNVAVEGLLAARPTVVSDLGGLREATEGYAAAVVVTPGRPELWADAVQHVVDDWTTFRAAALAAATVAAARHAPEPYSRRLSAVVLGQGDDMSLAPAVPRTDLGRPTIARRSA